MNTSAKHHAITLLESVVKNGKGENVRVARKELKELLFDEYTFYRQKFAEECYNKRRAEKLLRLARANGNSPVIIELCQFRLAESVRACNTYWQNAFFWANCWNNC